MMIPALGSWISRHRLAAAVLLLACGMNRSVRAEDSLDAVIRQDVVLRAMVDELARSQTQLHLAGLEKPYFIEYAIIDSATEDVQATLGAPVRHDHRRYRSGRSDVRVGSYQLDNSNFSGDSPWGNWFGGGALSVEDDYLAIRQALWWMTDADYKNVAEMLVHKKVFMESKLIKDKPDDFSREEPVIHFADRLDLSLRLDALKQTCLALSLIFRDYPALRDSDVNVSAFQANRYLANTEGTRMRTSVSYYDLTVSASAQADDGMMLDDSLSYRALTPDRLPSAEQMAADCRRMVDRLLALRQAPRLDSYTGPVLCDSEVAASLFSGAFSYQFAGGQREVGSGADADDFAHKLGKRILPRAVTVIDDPTQALIADQPVFGHYLYDDQGVRAQPVTLVDKGVLTGLVMSRNPSKEFRRSNGHGRGAAGPSAAIGNVLLTSAEGLSAAALKQELIDAFQDESLEFGIRLTSIAEQSGSGRCESGSFQMYKVFPDGREELVRGLEMSEVGLKAFKRMLAVGDTPYVLNTSGSGGDGGETVAVPALLFEELDLIKLDEDFDKPPILPSPLARDQAGASARP